jgi:hypothetical protein
MPKDKHNGAAEHHDAAAKAHRTAAEHHGKNDDGAGHEHSMMASGRAKKTLDQSMNAMKASEEKAKK